MKPRQVVFEAHLLFFAFLRFELRVVQSYHLFHLQIQVVKKIRQACQLIGWQKFSFSSFDPPEWNILLKRQSELIH